jgi:predicted short-subunit dehydrogenase-like oxidoreductase (DUF2520 family)
MKVVIIGSGNVATVLGGKAKAAGHEILQIVARNPETASSLAAEWACGYTTQWSGTDQTADIYVVALSDKALENLGGVLTLPGKLVVHTAGAVSVSALEPVSANSGVLYPLQSLRAAIRPFPETPLLIDALRQEDLHKIEAFALTLSGQVQQAGDATRLKLHVAAILVNNFTNYLYTQAARFCREEEIDFSLLLPLIRETAERVSRFPPEQLQTGPAVRGDRPTIEKHLEILSNYQDIKELYDLLTIKIEDLYRVTENPAPE